jgi:F0F1-type ATP synthase delta subunit
VAHEAKSEHKDFVLPVGAASPADVGRLIRELELIDEALLQLGLRAGGNEVKMPQTSRLMDQTIETNKLNLLHKEDRVSLKQSLAAVKQDSPVLHISFSADPTPIFIEKLMIWLRREIHPSVLLTCGLQPNIGAGCIVRTANKQFDFSLRQDFQKKRDLLLSQLAAPPAKPAPETKKAPA